MICTAMALRLIHLVHEETCEDGARLCSLLVRKLPASQISQQVVVMGARPPGLETADTVRGVQVARPLIWPFVSALPLQRRLRQERPDALIAWSPLAAAAAGTQGRDTMLAVTADPAEAPRWSRWRGALGTGGMSLVGVNGTVRRALIEAGVPADVTAVIRPGIDFAELRRAHEGTHREQLGIPANARVLLTTAPASRAGGQYFGAWAAAILQHIWPVTMLVVPGVSSEQRRIARLVDSIGRRDSFRFTGCRYSPAELMAVADALLVPALDDVPTGYVPWAMAAGVPIIGSAVPCVTEYLADRANAFLCRAGEPHTLAVRIRIAFDSPGVMAECAQTARHQAYETFRAERCVDEFLRAVHNLAAGRSALAGVQDAAVDA